MKISSKLHYESDFQSAFELKSDCVDLSMNALRKVLRIFCISITEKVGEEFSGKC